MLKQRFDTKEQEVEIFKKCWISNNKLIEVI